MKDPTPLNEDSSSEEEELEDDDSLNSSDLENESTTSSKKEKDNIDQNLKTQEDEDEDEDYLISNSLHDLKKLVESINVHSEKNHQYRSAKYTDMEDAWKQIRWFIEILKSSEVICSPL